MNNEQEVLAATEDYTPLYSIGDFNGPLDVLLGLIEKDKMDIADIPIALILDQYLEYLELRQAMDMDIAGEFIEMASTLMLIKSRMLLPKKEKEEEEDPRADLARKLLEYKQIKLAAQYLGERFEKFGGRFAKEPTNTFEPEPEESDVKLGLHTVMMLESAFRRIWNRFGGDEEELLKSGEASVRVVNRSYYPVNAKIIGLMRLLYKRGEMTFEELMLTSRTRSELVAAFTAVLELLKAGRFIVAPSSAREGEELIFRLDMTHRRKKKKAEEESLDGI